MAERYNPNKRKRRETTFSGLDALNQPAQQDTPFFGLEGREQLQGAKRRPITALPKQKRGFDMPGAQIKPTIPTDTNTPSLEYEMRYASPQEIPGRYGPVFPQSQLKHPRQASRPSQLKPNASGISYVPGAENTFRKGSSMKLDRLRNSILKEHTPDRMRDMRSKFGYQ